MRLKINHVSRYLYEMPPPYGLQQIRLTPRARLGQVVLNWTLDIEGGRKQAEFRDQHDNIVTLVSLLPDKHEITVECEGVVETEDRAGMFGLHDGRAPIWYYQRVTPLTQPGPRLRELLGALGKNFDNEVARLHGLSDLILKNVKYDVGQTSSVTSSEAALELGQGVCQDHAHIFVAAARQLGFSARYVSGYLMMDERVEQDAGHAWAEAFVPNVGWIGFDVANGISPDDRYVHVACGLDATEAAPITGITVGSRGESLSVTLQVQQQ
jgi:transglutaminase-like putative cysteine protease